MQGNIDEEENAKSKKNHSSSDENTIFSQKKDNSAVKNKGRGQNDEVHNE